MADVSKIEWTDATVNFWWGCTKISPGCDHCYAETWSKRTGGEIWGHGVPRRKIASAVKTLHRLDNGYAWWAADCEIGKLHDHPRRRVFIQSMSDLFDKEVPVEWFNEAWETIGRCDRIDIQIVTKRISFIEKRLAGKSWPKHAGLIISIVNQDEADRDIPRLIDLKARLGIPWIGLSCEPLLGSIMLHPNWLLHIDWIIVGGESGADARPMNPLWATSLRDQCAEANIPFLFKQWGEWAPAEAFGAYQYGPVTDRHGNVRNWMRQYVQCHDRADQLNAHSFTGHTTNLVFRVGKKRAGRLLENMVHDGFPAIQQVK